jgi:hypothetical protein
MLPPECEFVVHRQCRTGSLVGGTVRGMRDGFPDRAVKPREADYYTAVLASPDIDLDDLLAESPEWSFPRMQERLRQMFGETSESTR